MDDVCPEMGSVDDGWETEKRNGDEKQGIQNLGGDPQEIMERHDVEK